MTSGWTITDVLGDYADARGSVWRRYVVDIPTERGDTTRVWIGQNFMQDVYSVELSGELLRRSPEAVTAAVQMAMLAVQEILGIDRLTGEQQS